MILYFTGSGNSLASAVAIAQRVGEKPIDMGLLYKRGEFELKVSSDEMLGFCFPVHRWTVPSLVRDFVYRMRFATPDGSPFRPRYVFCVANYALMPGKATRVFEKCLVGAQGLALDSAFAVKSGNNCTFLFAPPEGEKKQRILGEAQEENERIAEEVSRGKHAHRVPFDPVGSLLTDTVGRRSAPFSTKPFFVDTTKCIGCGTCASVCPTNSIEMVGGRPSWSGSNCTECLACLHFCPVQASQHGKSTVGRGRYLNPIVDEV